MEWLGRELRRQAEEVRVHLATALNRVTGFTDNVGFAGRVYQHTHVNAPFSLPDPLKGSMDPYRMSFGVVLGSLLKKTLAVVQAVFPRWGLK